MGILNWEWKEICLENRLHWDGARSPLTLKYVKGTVVVEEKEVANS